MVTATSVKLLSQYAVNYDIQQQDRLKMNEGDNLIHSISNK
jgi:hypothetical protein